MTETSSNNNSLEIRPIRMTQRTPRRLVGTILVFALALLAVLLLIGCILILLGKNPPLALQEFLEGVLATPRNRADVIMFALPTLLCASGLLLTFTAGLWNIGVEGQINMGALFATIIARSVTPETSPLIALPAEIVMAMIGGALWAGVAALLKIMGNVNEIFGGVALNFISSTILLAVLNGPWGDGTRPQTAPFADPALLPRLDGVRLSPTAIMIAVVAFLIVFILLRGTRWGLQLRAMGKSERSAFLLGVQTKRNILLSMMLCGAFAGLAGAVQVLFTHGKLIANISSGVGFQGVLIVLLTNSQAIWVPLITLFFAAVPVGSLKLSSALEESVQIDASLGNVFQSATVLAILLANGIRAKFFPRKDS